MKNKPKILFLIDSLQTGGAEKSLLEITKRFKRVEPVICVVYKDKNHLENEFVKHNIKLIHLNIPRNNYLWLFIGFKKLKKVIKKGENSTIQTYLFKSKFIGRLFKLLNRDIILIDSIVSDTYSKNRYKNQSKISNIKLNIVKFFDKITSNVPDYYLVISKSLKHIGVKRFNIKEKKINVIYRGRNINDYYVDRKRKKTDNFIFIAVGRLVLQKNYPLIIEATHFVKQKTNKNFEVRIFGEGPLKQKLINKTKEQKVNNIIRFYGRSESIKEELKKADVFIFASILEGLGGALVEAKISGLPIIVSNINVFIEQIENKKNGLIFDVNNPKELAKKMLWVMENYDKAFLLGKEAQKDAISNFDIEIIAQQTEQFYLDIINK